MNEVERIADQLHRSYYGDAWHGPALQELLKDVTPQQAARRTISGAHTIWEIVLHIAAWESAAGAALSGAAMPALPWEGNWPAAAGARWEDAQAFLKRATDELESQVRKLPAARLAEIVPGREYSIYFLLHGVVQHNLYHAGQIALLKKQPEAAPSAVARVAASPWRTWVDMQIHLRYLKQPWPGISPPQRKPWPIPSELSSWWWTTRNPTAISAATPSN